MEGHRAQPMQSERLVDEDRVAAQQGPRVVRVYVGSPLGRTDGRQFLISVHDDGVVTSATRPTTDGRASWTEPVRLGEVRR